PDSAGACASTRTATTPRTPPPYDGGEIRVMALVPRVEPRRSRRSRRAVAVGLRSRPTTGEDALTETSPMDHGRLVSGGRSASAGCRAAALERRVDRRDVRRTRRVPALEPLVAVERQRPLDFGQALSGADAGRDPG